MNTKLTLWGTNEKEEKVFLALELIPVENKVNIYSFPEEIATEEFTKQMRDEWKSGKAILFPEGYSTLERKLSLTESLLPETLKVTRGDLIQRAQTEWHFIVLSEKLSEVYKLELGELKEKVEGLTKYDSKVWNSLKEFWSKVQGQVNERNLLRDQAKVLREHTNTLFDKMKDLRQALDKEFEDNSANYFASFKERLTDIEDKVSKGLNLNNIFGELKDTQRQFKESKMTRDHRSEIWSQLDGLFKLVKEKKFGADAGDNNSPTNRLQKRYDGLLNAIAKMEKSIKRDHDDLNFQNKRIAKTGGQLEAQIRQAKIKMIEERIKSKEEKLKDMLKTKSELEQKMEQQKQRDAARAEKAEKAKATKEAEAEVKAKIQAEMKEAEAERATKDDKLAKAAAAITGGAVVASATKATGTNADKGETTTEATTSENAGAAVEETKTAEAPKEQLADKVEETVAAATDLANEVAFEANEALENAIDTVKAIAGVFGANLLAAVEKVTEVVEDVAEAVEQKAEQTAETVEKTAEEVVASTEEEDGIEEIGIEEIDIDIDLDEPSKDA